MTTVPKLCIGAALAAALIAADCNTTPEPDPPPGSWLVLLCRASDVSATPQPASYYSGVFARDSILWQFFDEVSNHKIDIAGSRVRGWFNMSVGTAQINPTVRNNGTATKRDQTARDCKASALGGLAASGIGVDPAKYVGVITVINTPIDVGQAGKDVVAGTHFENQIGFLEHEMLHAYGLKEHSAIMSADASADHIYSSGTDTEYNDCWDIMSFQTCVFSYGTPHGVAGPGLQAAYRDKIGWLDGTRVFAPGPVSVVRQITLAPVSDPTRTGFLLARIEVPFGQYVVEYREPVGLDQNFGGSFVLIREERYAVKKTFLVTRQGGSNLWFKGDVFTDARNFLRISIDDIVPGKATITINTAFSPTGAIATSGQVCGNKNTGQTIPCSTGLTCAPRRTPPLVSIDYFCMP